MDGFAAGPVVKVGLVNVAPAFVILEYALYEKVDFHISVIFGLDYSFALAAAV